MQNNALKERIEEERLNQACLKSEHVGFKGNFSVGRRAKRAARKCS